MKNGKDVFRTISDYFSQPGNSEGNTLIAILIIILILVIAWAIIQNLQKKKKRKAKDIFDEIPEQDMELLKQISAQKGISSFDRDFLIMQALDYNVKPVKILLDIDTFEKVEKILEEKSKKDNVSGNLESSLKNLRLLKNKLF